MLPLHSFWRGPEATPLAAACLRLFVELGHPVTLHSYERVSGVPQGVGTADAAILPRDSLFIHGVTQSVVPFSDQCRYFLLALAAYRLRTCSAAAGR